MFRQYEAWGISLYPCGRLKSLVLRHDLSISFVGFEVKLRPGEVIRFAPDGSIDIDECLSEAAVEFKSVEDLLSFD